MGHHKDLSGEEQRKIAALSLAGWNMTEISHTIHQSQTAVRNYLVNGNGGQKGGKAAAEVRK